MLSVVSCKIRFVLSIDWQRLVTLFVLFLWTNVSIWSQHKFEVKLKKKIRDITLLGITDTLWCLRWVLHPGPILLIHLVAQWKTYMNGLGYNAWVYSKENTSKTRLHSSRMHTARLLTVSPSMHCSGGRGCLLGGGAWSWGDLLVGGVCSRGCLLRGGGCLVLGVWYPTCTEADPSVNRATDTCKNITLPQLRCGR